MDETLPAAPTPPALPAYPTLRESWAALGWLVLASLVVGIPVVAVSKQVWPASGGVKAATSLLASEATVLLTYWWLRRRAGARRWLGLGWPELAVRGQWLLLVPGLVLASDALLTMVRLLHLPDWTTQRYLDIARYPALALVLGGIASPVVEEILFRGVLLKGLLRNYRPWVAIGQSALLFGLIHASPAHSLSTALLGCVLGWLYYQTRSLGLCIAFHCINNLLAFLAMQHPRVQTDISLVQYLGWARYGGLLLAAALVLGASLWWLSRTAPLVRPPGPLLREPAQLVPDGLVG